MVNEPNENPYASPQVPIDAELDSLLEPDERIQFSGIVDPVALRQALRPRLSWPFLAIFMVGSLLCCAAAGPEFLQPWRTRIFYRSVPEDVLGVMGLGLLVLAVIHILSALFGDRWREKRVLAESPSVYVKAKSGYISAECLFLKESEGEAWLSWTSVGNYQVGDQVLLVDWANGATGGTVFSQDMFSSGVEFERVKRIFKQQVNPELSQHRLREMPDYFETDEIRSRQPTPEECIGESKKELSHRDSFRYLIAHIPRVLTVSCWPLHAYFALMLAITMVFTIHYRVCLGLVLIAWGGILGTAILISLVQHRHLYFRGSERLIKSRIQFTSREVHFQMTGSYGVLAIDRVVMTEHTNDKINFRIEDATVSSTLERKDFRSDEDWRAVLELLA